MIEVAVVGMGPWGLAVLERLVSAAIERQPSCPQLTVHVVEPAVPGPGVFGGDQPDYLILNTPCGEHSGYPFPEQAAGRRGSGFYEWAVASGYRWVGERCEIAPDGRPLSPHDFLPRRLMGEYLAWFYRTLLEEAPASLRIVHHPTVAVGCTSQGGRERLALASGTVVEVDHVVLTTGHTPNERSTPSFMLPPYPVGALDRRIEPGSSVAIRGMGLVAIDVLTALTTGRGGTFARRNGRLQYLPSGHEPSMVLFSRSGFPYCAKSRGAADMTGGYRPAIFTPEAIAELRGGPAGAPGRRRVDARSELLPLVLAEMTACYYHQAELLASGPEAADATASGLARAWRDGRFEVAVAALGDRLGHYDAAADLFVGEGEWFLSAKDYQAAVTAMLEGDVAAARVPNGTSPRKRAQEVLRALRDSLRDALEFGGLTAASQLDFQANLRNRLARLVAGPPVERSERLLALLDSGVLRAPFGPAPAVLPARSGAVIVSRALDRPYAERVEHLVVGHLDEPTAHRSASPLLRQLYARGRIRQLCLDGEDVGSVELSEDFHPVSETGVPERHLWCFGALTEGARYYTAYLPSPASRARAFLDAGRCVEEILGGRP